LRHQGISFVAATPVEQTPSKPQSKETVFVAADDSDLEDGEESGDDDVDDSTLQTNLMVDTDVEISEGGMAQMNLQSSGEMSEDDTGPTSSDADMKDAVQADEELFVIDTVGDASLKPKSKASGKRPVRRSPSPAASESSSDEGVVFSGRGRPRTIDDPFSTKPAQAPKQAERARASARPANSISTQQRSDALAAWNSAAKTLPKEFQSAAAESKARAAEPPRGDTIKETFKRTSVDQGKLGTPRKYDSIEHTVHDSAGTRPARPASAAPPPVEANPEEPHVADDLLSLLQGSNPDRQSSWPSDGAKARGWGAAPSKADREVNLDATWAPAPAGSWWRKGKGKQRPDLDLPAAEKMAIDQSPPKQTKVSFADAAPEVLEAGPSHRSRATDAKNENDAVVESTIATLQAEVKQVLKAKRQAKQSSRTADVIALESPKATKSTRRSKRGRKKDNRLLRGPIELDDDGEDGASEAAYEDYMNNLIAQSKAEDGEAGEFADLASSSFAKSFSLGGPSLVVDGQEIFDDEVLQSHAEAMNGGNEDEWTTSESDGPIGEDVSDLSDDEEYDYDDLPGDSDSVDSSVLEGRLAYTEKEQWEDEEDLRKRRQDAMSDEKLARLIAKQQEFGIGSDELILDDGLEMDGVGDVYEARAGLANLTNIISGPRKTKSRRSGGRNDFSFPDATALADTVDQYGADGFDIMDFDRPSLRPKKKGRKGKLHPELDDLSDDELKENMGNAWENDREKKRLKKAEREEMRAAGMLGSTGRKGKADLNEKYKYVDGMTQSQILDELREFMRNDGQQSRPFPPMDTFNRKKLHQIANQLNLKSKSVGTGAGRYPVLYKTKHTLEYSDQLFRDTMSSSNRGGLSVNVKFARKAKRAGGKGPGKKGGLGGGISAASVNHGEIVGAGAAEMGRENRGFKFMEKMGWTPGMALGREGVGRLVPVEQMMRQGRAGLG